jgi:hypothetical protein
MHETDNLGGKERVAQSQVISAGRLQFQISVQPSWRGAFAEEEAVRQNNCSMSKQQHDDYNNSAST